MTSAPQSVVISIAIPAQTSAAAASRRLPRYVSMNTQSAAVTLDGGKPVVTDLSASSKSCTTAASGRTCTLTVNASPGVHTFGVTLFASRDGSGAALSQNTTSATIAAGAPNVVKLQLGGIVASVALSLTNANPVVGTAATYPLVVTFRDASGAIIIGSDAFVNTVTLTDSDSTGATTMSKPAPTITSPDDVGALTVAYTGANIAQAVFSATAPGLAAAAVTPAVLTPQTPATALVDWPTYAFDSARSGYNPYTTGITPASIANLHLAWQTSVHGSTQSQPIVITNVAGHQALLIVANFAIAEAYDALSGTKVWSRTLPTQDVQDCGAGGISGTAQYDKALGALFMAAGDGNGAPNHVVLYRLDAATGNITGQTDVTPTLVAGEGNYAHTGITLANGRVYLGTGSDCEGTPIGKYPSWRGRVVSVDPSSMTLNGTFYTTWQHGGNFGGGGVWGWGGVSSDANGNVFVAAGNAETPSAVAPQTIAPPFDTAPNEQAGFGENLIKVSSDLSTALNANYPGFNFSVGHGDLDFTGTPVVVEPPLTSGCGELTATQGKGGALVIHNAQTLGVQSTFQLSVPSSSAYYMGNPAYSPATGLIYAAVSSSGPGGTLLPPGLAAIGNCGSSISWNAQFGPDSSLYGGERPRSAPTVTAGGVVFMGTPCTNDGRGGCGSPGTVNGALWAVDGTGGLPHILGGGKPVLMTGDNIRMAPSADGLWVWVLDGSGNFYGLTVDPAVKAIAPQSASRMTARMKFHAKD